MEVSGNEFQGSFLQLIDKVAVGPNQQVEDIVNLYLVQQNTETNVLQISDVVLVGGHEQQFGFFFG